MKKTYSSQFKSKVALEALQGDKTIAEIAGKYQVHVNQVQQWKKKLLDNAEDIFATASERQKKGFKMYSEDDLMKKIGRQQIEIDFLRRVSLACGLNPEKSK